MRVTNRNERLIAGTGSIHTVVLIVVVVYFVLLGVIFTVQRCKTNKCGLLRPMRAHKKTSSSITRHSTDTTRVLYNTSHH